MVIASSTGWSEHYIRWQLPLSRGHAYYHAARVLAGESFRWPGGEGPVKSWLAGVRQRVRKLWKSTPRPD